MTVGPPSREKLWTANFLQTAIVLDDQGYSFGGSDKVGTLTKPSDAPGRRALSAETREAVEPKTRGRELNDLDTKALTDSFADYGIVCGVLCPTPADVEAESSRLLSAARRSDIVILDWQIDRDEGNVAKSIIFSLVEAEATRNALKLVCIYTADKTNINNIVAAIEASLESKAPKDLINRVSDYELVVGPLRVLLFSKVQLEIPDKELAARYSAEKDLPGRIVEEFEHMTSGLLQRVAIRALAALRGNTHSLAARFSMGLDAGYLWHRGALSDPSDAEAHVREILANELDSIIEVSDSVEAAGAKECERVVDGFKEPLNARFDIKERVSYDDVKAVLDDNGKLDDISKKIRKKLSREDPVTNIIAFSDTVANAMLANEQFAMIMTLRTHYDNTPRRLHLGTVLRSEEDGKAVYYICLQPFCDSHRIDKSRKFPLLPIDIVEQGTFNLVLPISAERAGHFSMKYHPYRLVMREFAIDADSTGAITAKRVDNKYKLCDLEKHEYEWLAELRGPIAHRIAQKLSNQFGRIGLDVPEWIRERD